MVTSLALWADLADVIEESRLPVEQNRRVRGVVIISQEPGPRLEKPKGLNRPVRLGEANE